MNKKNYDAAYIKYNASRNFIETYHKKCQELHLDMITGLVDYHRNIIEELEESYTEFKYSYEDYEQKKNSLLISEQIDYICSEMENFYKIFVTNINNFDENLIKYWIENTKIRLKILLQVKSN